MEHILQLYRRNRGSSIDVEDGDGASPEEQTRKSSLPAGDIRHPCQRIAYLVMVAAYPHRQAMKPTIQVAHAGLQG